MKINLLEAVKKELEGTKARAEANLDVLISNPVGIGEHPQHIDEIDKLIEKIAEAEDKKTALKAYIIPKAEIM